MTEVEREAVRAKVRADNEKFLKALAPLYLGKICPIIDRECEGPNCAFFLLTSNNDRGAIDGGGCSIPLIASQVGPIGGGLAALAEAAAQNAPKIQTVPSGIVKP